MKLRKTFAAMLSCVMAGSMCIAAENVLPDSLMPITASAAESYGDLSYENHDTYIEITDCDMPATSIVIPEEIDGLPVTMIGDFAFSNCTRLKSITIPDSVTSIGDHAFENCNSLTSITIPDSVTSIGDHAFEFCNSLESINVSANNLYFSSQDGVLFNKDKTVLIKCPAKNQRTEYVIPDSVKNISSGAFSYCVNLTSIAIPDSVTSIENFTFFYCESLTSIIIPDSVMSIGYIAFEYCTSLTSIKIPSSVTEIDNYALGYIANDLKIDSFTIYGTPGTAAEKYALENDFAFIEVNNASAITMGDINSDGNIDALDASEILIEYANVATGKGSSFDEAQIQAADLNNDGAIDALDASTVLIYYAYKATGGDKTIEEFLKS